MKKDNILNDLFSKSLNLKFEISEKITEIMNGKNTNLTTIDKVKQKIYEKIENMQETIKLLESELEINKNNSINSKDNLLLWKK
jgi:hypothetical protein